MGAFRNWKRSAIIELRKTMTKVGAGGQVGMEWSSTKKKFEMDETQGLVVMIENASRKGVEALENMIGSENVHHATEIMAAGEKRTGASPMKHAKGQAEEGSDDSTEDMSHISEILRTTISLSTLSGIKQQSAQAKGENHCSQQEERIEGASLIVLLAAFFSLIEV